MTISSNPGFNDYPCNGSTTDFPFTFKVFDDTDLKVFLRNTDTGAITDLAINTHYTVEGAGDGAGGTVTTLSTYDSPYTLHIRDNQTIEQQTDLRNQTRYSADTVETELDRLAMIQREQQKVLDRCLKIADGDTSGVSVELEYPDGGLDDKVLAFDADGDVTASDTVAGGVLVSAAMEPVVGAASLASARSAMGPWNDTAITALSSLTARTLEDRFAEQFNVKDYGAVGDGSANDASAIQAAIDAAESAGGGIVFFPAGTYKISAARLTIQGDGIVLRGSGRGATTLQWHGTPPAGVFGGTQGMITAYPSDAVYPAPPGSYGTTLYNIGIENMTLIGLAEGIYTAGRQGIQMENVINGYVRNCHIKDFGAESILFDAAIAHYVGEYYVEDNEIEGGGNFFNSGGDAIFVARRNFCHDNDFQGVELGAGSGQTVCSNNIFRDMASGSYVEIQMDRAVGVANYRSGVIFTANSFEGCDGILVDSQGGSQPTSILVANNVFHKGTGAFNITYTGGASTDAYVMISNNVMSEMVNGGGILLQTFYGAVVTNNLIFKGPTGTATYGIQGDANAIPVVYGNVVYGFPSGQSIVMSNTGARVGQNVIDGVYKSSTSDWSTTSYSGQISSLADDAVSTVVNSDTLGAARVGILTVCVRSQSTIYGRTLQTSFSANTSGIGHHTQISNHGSTIGTNMAVSTATLAGTTGSDGYCTVSVNTSGGKWQIQIENRLGEAITVGWDLTSLG